VGDPDRLAIIRLLQAGPQSVGDIAQGLHVPLANVSHHLKQLKTARVVISRKKGRSVFYSLAPHIARSGSPGRLDVLDFGCCRLDLGPKSQ
jgi:DNA-binding transcriptional ArsR family regulator